MSAKLTPICPDNVCFTASPPDSRIEVQGVTATKTTFGKMGVHFADTGMTKPRLKHKNPRRMDQQTTVLIWRSSHTRGCLRKNEQHARDLSSEHQECGRLLASGLPSLRRDGCKACGAAEQPSGRPGATPAKPEAKDGPRQSGQPAGSANIYSPTIAKL